MSTEKKNEKWKKFSVTRVMQGEETFREGNFSVVSVSSVLKPFGLDREQNL
jgi:hypothetical protein